MELENKIQYLKQKTLFLKQALHIEDAQKTLHQLEKQMSHSNFWNQQENSQKVVQKLKSIKALVEPFEKIQQEIDDLQILSDMAKEEQDHDTLQSLYQDAHQLEKQIKELTLRTYFHHPNDKKNCYLSIHPGSGGTESCDWAEMLLRMYTRWLEKKKFQLQILDYINGEEAGIKKATLLVKGPYAFGYLKSEIGVHRLVRISPFDANKRRHTSFASVDVYPELDDIEIEIQDDDLQIDTYRASGAGGQHVNTTDSAVRITHLPTGVTVQCQNERSQHKNKATALKMLKAKLHQLEEAKRDQERKKLYGQKGEIAWGNQIRSYILQPYTLVKDQRTNYSTPNVQQVLEGNLDELIENYLKWHTAQNNKDNQWKKLNTTSNKT